MSKTTDLTEQRLTCADLIGCPNELLSPIKQIDNLLYFHDTRKPQFNWSVKLTPTGRIKKNSLRN